MKWESKIQIGTGGIQGYNEWSLLYDTVNQEIYAELYGHKVEGQEPEVIYHKPDDGAAVPIRVTEKNKFIYLETVVLGVDNNAVIASINVLKRVIRQASEEGAEAVRTAITPSGSAWTTYNKIIQGHVDDSEAYYQATEKAIARNVVLILECEPGGYGDSFVLRNDLPSSPHMLEGNTSGLADGLTKIGAPSATKVAGTGVTGGYAQYISCSAPPNRGISFTTVSSAADTTAAGFVILRVISGSASVNLYDVFSGQVLLSETELQTQDSGNVSDFQFTSPDGVTYYRVPFSISFTVGHPIRLDVYGSTDTTIFLVDSAYLQFGITSAPPAFSSSAQLKNRNDRASTSAATRQQINYLDVSLVPGDLPPLVKYSLKAVTATAFDDKEFISLAGARRIENYKYWWDNTELVFAGFSAWTTTADAARAGGSYSQSPTGVIAALSFKIPLYSDIDVYKAFNSTPCRIFGIVYSSGNEVTVSKLDNPINGSLEFTETVFSVAKYQILDLGTYSPASDMSEAGGVTASTDALKWGVTQVSGGYMRLDAILCLPITNGYSIAEKPEGGVFTGASGNTWDMSQLTDDSFIRENSRYAPHYGSFPDIIPGQVENRIIWLREGNIATPFSTQGHYITDEVKVTLTITPRTSHLLGVS